MIMSVTPLVMEKSVISGALLSNVPKETADTILKKRTLKRKK